LPIALVLIVDEDDDDVGFGGGLLAADGIGPSVSEQEPKQNGR
jgi:hypothetical protein